MTNKDTNQHNTQEIDVLALIGMLMDYRWLIIGITSLFMLAGIAYALLATPVYQANTLLQIEERKAGLAGLDIMDDLFTGKTQSSAEIEIIKSRMVIGKAVENLRLNIVAQPQRFPIIGNFFSRRFHGSEEQAVAPAMLGLNKYDWGGAKITLGQFELSPALIGKDLRLKIKDDKQYEVFLDKQLLLSGRVGEVSKSTHITLEVSEIQARVGQEFLVKKNDPLNTTRSYQTRLKASEKGKLSGMLTLSLQHTDAEQASRVLDEIAQIYVRQNIDRSAAEASSSLEFLQTQLPSVRAEVEEAESRLNQFQTSAKSADITVETKTILDQLVRTETELSELQLKQFEMDKLFTHEHPQYQSLLNQINSLEQKKLELEKRVGSLPEVQQELLRLNRDIGVSSQIYTLLLQKSQELDIAKASAVGNVRIIDTAVTEPNAVAPKKKLVVLIATLLGGMFSVFLAFAHSILNRGIEDLEELESLDISVFASIPYSDKQSDLHGKGKEKLKHMPLLTLDYPTELSVEAFRSLHTSLHFTIPEAKNNILMISGPSPKIGKSFVSSNLAATLALAGKKVLLIDADMRKGYLHYYFGNQNSIGLSSLLSGQSSIEECLQTDKRIDNFHFISRGIAPPNPNELLLSPRFEHIMQELNEQYDIIIIDTPPVLAVSDAIAIGRIAGSCFITVRYGVNPVAEVRAAIKRFEDNGISLKGAIFNAVEKKASHRYRYGYDYYQYDYKSES